MGIETTMLLRLKIGLSSSEVVQTGQPSARNIMVIARMPEDRSKTLQKQTVKNRQTPSKPYTP
eukprot:16310795-Heterocapsa_arctica.AAC.1